MDIRRFTGLENSVTPVMVDARHRLRELFNCLSAGHGHAPPDITREQLSRITRALLPQPPLGACSTGQLYL